MRFFAAVLKIVTVPIRLCVPSLSPGISGDAAPDGAVHLDCGARSDDEQLDFMTAFELRRLIATCAVSPVELTERALTRAEASKPP